MVCFGMVRSLLLGCHHTHPLSGLRALQYSLISLPYGFTGHDLVRRSFEFVYHV